ncbi:hypothetical protein [Desulfobacca acetoxidans]|nr:hypothetical protein [Desulfobacterales bacterium]
MKMRWFWGVLFSWCLILNQAMAAEQAKTLPIEMGFSAGLGFDSNVSSNPMQINDESAQLKYGTGDFFYEHNANIGYTLPVTSDFGVKAQYFVNQNFHFRLTRFDILSHNISLIPKLRLFNNSGELVGLCNFNYLDIGSDKYRTFFTFIPTYFQMLTEKLMLETSLGYERRYYYAPIQTCHDDASAHNYTAGIGVYYFTNPERTAYLQMRFGYEGNAAFGNNWDYQAFRLLTAAAFPIVQKLRARIYLDLTYQWFSANWFDAHKSANPIYVATHPPFPKRQDEIVAAGAQFFYDIRKDLALQANMDVVRDSSNIFWYAYDRYVFSLFLNYHY